MNKIIQGDCLEVLKTLPDESVDCVVTSPPYWALRDYGVEGQLGLEPTFQEYVVKLRAIFDEVKRVLKKEGTCWVNLGDTYNAGGNYRGTELGDGSKEVYRRKDFEGCQNDKNKQGIPPKSLCNIPARFSIAMQDGGWILRNEIIWYKPNCMPSSIKDRFTVDFEKVFFFVKNKNYYFETQLEPVKDVSIKRAKYGLHNTPCKERAVDFRGNKMGSRFVNPKGRNKRCVWTITTKSFREAHFATYPETLIEPMIKAGCPENGIVLDPFFGAGTTGLVALKQNKQFIGIELNPAYIEIANKRLKPYLEQTTLK